MDNVLDLSRTLNPRQLEAVTHTEGPLLILAGAGSGKTRVITYRIAYLIREKGVRPGNIMAVTFTNKAAAEMRERVTKLLGGLSGSLWVSTFHSACVRILRKDIDRLGYSKDFVIYDSADSKALIKSIIKQMDINEQMYNPAAITGRISSLKNALISPEAYAAEAQTFGMEAKTAQVYTRYQETLKRNNAVDFDDLMMLTVRLFRKEEDILSRYQEQVRYLMVDEYQDTNHAQYSLVRLLAGERRNICVVGDDDQSIYRFRGADIRNILDFEKDYPDVKEIKLEQNYRSTKLILKAAGAVVDKNLGRKKKTLWTENIAGEKIVYYRAESEEDEAHYACRAVLAMTQKGERKLGDVAFLYRTNAQSRVLEEALGRTGLPYRVVGGLRFYDRKEVKDILAYLKLIANPDDGVSLKRIINTPPRGIGETTVGKIDEYSQSSRTPLYQAAKEMIARNLLPSGTLKKIAGFISTIDPIIALARSPEASATEIIKQVFDASGYGMALQQEGTDEAGARLENIRELLSAAEDYEDETEDKSLSGFLDKVALVADVDSLTDEGGAITLMTLHSVKGLEFPVVFISGMEEGIFPHSRALTSDVELEEERRLCYVGITRARERLYLTNAKRRRLYGAEQWNAPSRFLYDIPDEVLDTVPARNSFDHAGSTAPRFASHDLFEDDSASARDTRRQNVFANPAKPSPSNAGSSAFPVAFPVGASVLHPKWGAGKVKGIDGAGEMAKVTVYFVGIGEKVLVQKYANLVKL